jgi:hypothetical protein
MPDLSPWHTVILENQFRASDTGGALLLHGLSDSPYSLRAVAEILHDAGYHYLRVRAESGSRPKAVLAAEVFHPQPRSFSPCRRRPIRKKVMSSL